MADTVVDADDASDDEVAAALGIGNDSRAATESDAESQDGADEGDEQEEVGIAALMAEIKELRKETATLKREQAAARVRSKERAKVASAGDGTSAPAEDVTQAEERGREAARLEYGIRLAGAEVRAALATVIPAEQMDEFVDDLNLSKYVGDDGEVDKESIKALKDRQTALLGATRRTPKVNNGRTGKPTTAKSTADQFADALTSFL